MPGSGGRHLSRARGRWKIPVLLRIVNCPVPAQRMARSASARGTIPTAPCSTSRGAARAFPSIPAAPTLEQAREALEYLDDTLFEEFPFVEKVDRSVALSLVLTALDRHAMATAPLHAFTSPVAGNRQVAAGRYRFALGQWRDSRRSSRRARTRTKPKSASAPSCSAATPSSRSITAAAEVDSELLCQALTQRELRVRELGYSRNVRVPITALFVSTATTWSSPTT